MGVGVTVPITVNLVIFRWVPVVMVGGQGPFWQGRRSDLPLGREAFPFV